jgi:hypothetical protein
MFHFVVDSTVYLYINEFHTHVFLGRRILGSEILLLLATNSYRYKFMSQITDMNIKIERDVVSNSSILNYAHFLTDP